MCLVQLQSKQHIHSFMQQIFIECILSAGHCSGHWEIIDEKHGQGPYFMELTLVGKMGLHRETIANVKK